MEDRTHEIDLILSGALDSTAGRSCWAGCAEPIEDGRLHQCIVTAATTTAMHGQAVEVRVWETLQLGRPYFHVWQRADRGRVTDLIGFYPKQALAVGEALIELARQAGERGTVGDAR